MLLRWINLRAPNRIPRVIEENVKVCVFASWPVVFIHPWNELLFLRG